MPRSTDSGLKVMRAPGVELPGLWCISITGPDLRRARGKRSSGGDNTSRATMTASLASPPAFDYAMQAFPHSRYALALVVLTHVVCALLLVKLLDAHRTEPRLPLIVEILQPPPEIPEKLVPKKKPLEPKIEEPPLPPEIVPERVLLEPPTAAVPLPQFDLPPPPEPAVEVRPEPRQTPQQITVEPDRMAVPVLQARREPVPMPVATPNPTPTPVPLIEPTAPVRESPMPPRLAPPKETIRDLPLEPIRFAQAPTMPTPTVLEPYAQWSATWRRPKSRACAARAAADVRNECEPPPR